MATAYFAPAAKRARCDYCGSTTYWRTYCEDDAEWIPACRPGSGCAKGLDDPFVDLSVQASERGISLSLAMGRISAGMRRIEVICAPRRILNGDSTPQAEIGGVVRPLSEWAKMYDIKYQTIRKRYLSGKSGPELVSKPQQRKRA
jgi:hypothetical protein